MDTKYKPLQTRDTISNDDKWKNKYGILYLDGSLKDILRELELETLKNPYSETNINDIGVYVTANCKKKHTCECKNINIHQTFRFILKNGDWFKCILKSCKDIDNPIYFYLIRYKFVGILTNINKVSIQDVFWDNHQLFSDINQVFTYLEFHNRRKTDSMFVSSKLINIPE